MTTDADDAVQKQAEEMTRAGDLRTCHDCGAWVCYIFTKRDWPGHYAACGKWTLASDSCPQHERMVLELHGPWVRGTS